MQANPSKKEPIILVRNLSARFGRRVVLKEVNFQIYPNEIAVILGTSGCGKTTVLKHLFGLYPIQKGEVFLMGERLNEITEDDYQRLVRKVGVLFQNGALLNSLTVAENVAIPLEQHTRLPEDLIEYLVRVKLKLVELSQAFYLYPSQLSGGMRKRAALARALALDPPLLFCDEPSAGLDPLTLQALDELFLKLKNQLGITIVMVTHEIPSIFRLADRVIFLHRGEVIFNGSLPDAVARSPEPVREFFRVGMADTRHGAHPPVEP